MNSLKEYFYTSTMKIYMRRLSSLSCLCFGFLLPIFEFSIFPLYVPLLFTIVFSTVSLFYFAFA